RRNLLHSARGPNRHRELAAALQHDQAARIARIQTASTAGICPCLRRVAGCATPPGSAGHASATASLKLTFHLDHSVGADQFFRSESSLLTQSQSGLWPCAKSSFVQSRIPWVTRPRFGTAMTIVFALRACAIQSAASVLPVPHGMTIKPRAALLSR